MEKQVEVDEGVGLCSTIYITCPTFPPWTRYPSHEVDNKNPKACQNALHKVYV